MLNKVKTMKLSDCIEVKKAEYTYIQVIPSKSCRNTNTDKLLVLANTMYQKLDKLYKIENKNDTKKPADTYNGEFFRDKTVQQG